MKIVLASRTVEIPDGGMCVCVCVCVCDDDERKRF